MTSLTAWRNRFWFAPSSGRPEAAFRVGYSLFLFCNLITLYPKAALLLSDRGILGAARTHGLYPVEAVYAVFWIWMAAAVLLFFGFKARFFAVLNFACHFYFWWPHTFATAHAGDWLSYSMAFYLMLMTSDRHFALSKAKKPPKKPCAVWPVRLAQINFAGLYFTAGLSKLPDAGWINGTALRDTLLNPFFSKFDFSGVLPSEPFLQWINYAVTGFELLVPLLLIPKKTRIPAVIMILLFHLLIDSTLRVGWFTYLASAYLFVFWDDIRLGSRRKPDPAELQIKKPPVLVQSFIYFHVLAFFILHIHFANSAIQNFSKSLESRAAAGKIFSPAKIPFFSFYGSVTGIRDFALWPSELFLRPVKFIFLEADNGDGKVVPIPPFSKEGEFKPGRLAAREVREGLLMILASHRGLTLDQWKAYTTFLIERYQTRSGGQCPKELRISLIKEYLENFKGPPKDLNLEKPLILTVGAHCEKPEPVLDFQFTELGKSNHVRSKQT